MVNYKCVRCGYFIDRKSSMKDHLIKKKICEPKLNDIDLKIFSEYILSNNIDVINYLISNNENEIRKNESEKNKIEELIIKNNKMEKEKKLMKCLLEIYNIFILFIQENLLIVIREYIKLE